MHKIDRVALIVPHWELLNCNDIKAGDIIPRNFVELNEMVEKGAIQPFHASVTLIGKIPEKRKGCTGHSGRWTRGVSPSNYKSWYEKALAREFGFFKVDVETPRFFDNFEPFVVVRRTEGNEVELPRYAEQYVGRFLNKVSFVDSLKSKLDSMYSYVAYILWLLCCSFSLSILYGCE